jgi:CheY-like chemotaxis protein
MIRHGGQIRIDSNGYRSIIPNGIDLTMRDHSLERGSGRSAPMGRDLLTWSPFVKATPTAREVSSPVRTLSGQVEPAVEAKALGLRILVVEDNSITQEVVVVMLNQLGYPADLASNGVEALAAIYATTYDLILMDLQMPEMDGMEASRRIRSAFTVPLQPTIVAMTASLSLEDQLICVEAGMDQHLPKPLRIDALASGLETWVPRHQVEQ